MDADLIETLWKQDVDLGIPLEDYRPSAPPAVNASTSAKSYVSKNEEDLKLKRESCEGSVKERRVRSIDAETGEPIFENLPGPSSSNALSNCSSSDFDISALIGGVSEEWFSTDWVNENGFSDCPNPPYNGTDPFGGVLLQNVTLPSSIEAAAENITMHNSGHANNSFQEQYRPTTTTLGSPEVPKSTVTDHQAVRDLLTYNASSHCGLDTFNVEHSTFELFHEDLALNASAVSARNQQHRAASNTKEMEHQSFPSHVLNSANVSLPKPVGNYASSDTGVSSMYSDEGNEEWMESASEASSPDQDAERLIASGDLNYNSSSSLCAAADMCMLPQKKYNFFGRKPNYVYGQGFRLPHEGAGNDTDTLVLENSPAVNGYLHNHTYTRESSSSYAAAAADAQFLIKHEQNTLLNSSETSNDLRFTDGYASSDPSDMSSIQATSARDERRAKELGIPISSEDIVTLSIDEFNERLARCELSDEQHSLIRDIRRRGKNKVAAQNCRKRKIDQISALQEEVDRLHQSCRSLEKQNEGISRRHRYSQEKVQQLRSLIVAASGAIPKNPPMQLED